jgi:ComF family protein
VQLPRVNLRSFFDQKCNLCRLEAPFQAGLCRACLHDLPRITPACRRCALPVTGGTELTCGRCQKHPPAFDATLAAFAYRFPLNQLIPLIKYHNQPAALGWLADTFAEYLRTETDTRPQVLIPVPLAPSRLRRRGYNQAALLAQRLANRLGLALDQRSLTKPRDTDHQMELTGKARRRNLKGAFAWRGPAYTHVALIDDVMTTGTTASEISRLLKKHGVGRVDIWVLARTPAPGDH